VKNEFSSPSKINIQQNFAMKAKEDAFKKRMQDHSSQNSEENVIKPGTKKLEEEIKVF